MQATKQTTKQIQSLITKAVKAANTSKQAIQDAIDATVRHAWQHGDVSLINRLMADLPKGVQLEKIKQYLQEVAPVRPNKSIDVADKGYYKYRKLSDDSEKISLSILSDCAWWDYQPFKADKPVGVDTAKVFKGALTSLLKKLKEQTDLTSYEVEAMKALEKAVVDRAERAAKAERDKAK
mgnify:CR=1 FL=1